MKVIKPEELNKNVFSMIGKEWLLVTAEKEGKVNTMTASWGGLGVMWGKDVAFIVLRPQRYTKEFVDAGETFSLSVLGGERRKTLNYLGTVSGRDEDKVAKSGLTVEREDGTPYFGEADTVLICRKLYRQDMTPESFLDAEIREKNYPNNDYHRVFVGEIKKLLIRE